MKKLPKKHIPIFVLAFILITSLCAMIYFGNQKEGYHVDELYSYGLANSEYLPFMHFGLSGYDVKDWMNEYGAGESFVDLFSNLIKDFKILQECDFDFYGSEIYQAYLIAQANSADTYTTTWVPGQDYVDYLAVSESNTFNYASVYYNQRGDVHPPFFYMLLHTICSIFQGSFSKWYGLALNIMVLLTALVVLYKMSEKHFGGSRAALVITAVYAFSAGFMSTAMFIRMYALLTLMTLLCLYVHLEILKSDFKFTKKLIAALFFSVLGGYYTQYYFVLYAIVLAAVMLIIMVLHRKWKSILTYVMTLAGAAVTGIIIWPFAIKHVFRGYRGTASLEVLKTGEFYLFKAEHMWGQIVSNIFGGHKWIPVLLVILAIIGCNVSRKKIPFAKLSLLCIPIVAYTYVVCQISPFLSDRYVMCTYPFWCIMVVSAVFFAAKAVSARFSDKLSFGADKLAFGILLAASILLIGTNNYFINTPGYLNPGGQEAYEVPANTDCVFVIPDGSYNESSDELNILAQCNRVGVVYEGNIDILATDYMQKAGDYLLVEVINFLDENVVLDKVLKSLGATNYKEISRDYTNCSVRILLKK